MIHHANSNIPFKFLPPTQFGPIHVLGRRDHFLWMLLDEGLTNSYSFFLAYARSRITEQICQCAA